MHISESNLTNKSTKEKKLTNKNTEYIKAHIFDSNYGNNQLSISWVPIYH